MKKIASLTIALTMGFSGALIAQAALTEPQVQARLSAQGYTGIDDLRFHDGVWMAHARSGDGHRTEVRIDPKTGQIYPEEQVSRLSERDVRAALSTEGYTRVHDVDYKDGVWKAKARNAAGKRVKLLIDPSTGRVIGTN
jgi:hypothetical protein